MELLYSFPFIAISVNFLNMVFKIKFIDPFLIFCYILIILIEIFMERRNVYSFSTTKNTLLRFVYVLLLIIVVVVSHKNDLWDYKI